MSTTIQHPRTLKRLIVTLVLATAFLAPSYAHAWTMFPGLPNPVTWVIHFVGGVLIEYYAEKIETEKINTEIGAVKLSLNGESEIDAIPEDPEENLGIVSSGTFGVLKEFTDLNFDPIDAVMWPLGAAAYRLFTGKPVISHQTAHTPLLNSPALQGEIPWVMQPYFPYLSPEDMTSASKPNKAIASQ